MHKKYALDSTDVKIVKPLNRFFLIFGSVYIFLNIGYGCLVFAIDIEISHLVDVIMRCISCVIGVYFFVYSQKRAMTMREMLRSSLGIVAITLFLYSCMFVALFSIDSEYLQLIEKYLKIGFPGVLFAMMFVICIQFGMALFYCFIFNKMFFKSFYDETHRNASIETSV